MKCSGTQLSRREFVGRVGLGVAALGALQGKNAFAAGSRVLGANDRIRIGLIGAGDRGQEDLKSALRQKNVECVAVADVYSRRCDEVKAFVPNVAAYDDPMRLLERTDIDGVINATPQHLHAKYFLATLDSGKDLYSEKTLAWDIPEVLACRNAAKASKQIVQIGMQDESAGEMMDARVSCYERVCTNCCRGWRTCNAESSESASAAAEISVASQASGRWRSKSTTPPEEGRATMGSPAAAASKRELGMPSWRDESTKSVAPGKHA